jgi:hypothetical protein
LIRNQARVFHSVNTSFYCFVGERYFSGKLLQSEGDSQVNQLAHLCDQGTVLDVEHPVTCHDLVLEKTKTPLLHSQLWEGFEVGNSQMRAEVLVPGEGLFETLSGLADSVGF